MIFISELDFLPSILNTLMYRMQCATNVITNHFKLHLQCSFRSHKFSTGLHVVVI